MPADKGGKVAPLNSLTTYTSGDGITRRGDYARSAMEGLLSRGWSGEQTDKRLAMRAFEIADAMIAYEDST